MTKINLLLFLILLAACSSISVNRKKDRTDILDKNVIVHDSIKNASDSALTRYFHRIYSNYDLSLEERIDSISKIVDYIEDPNIMFNRRTMIYELSCIDGYIGYEAVKSKAIKIIEKLIAKKAFLNVPNGIQRITPIFVADDANIARILLENGADPNFHSEYGWTMFHEDNMTLDRLRLAKEFDFDFKYFEDQNKTLLHVATNNTRSCWVEELDYLIKQIPHYINRFDDLGFAPIHYYVRDNFNDFYPLVDLLIKNGADPYIKTQRDYRWSENILIPKGSTSYDIIGLINSRYTDATRESNKAERDKVLKKLKP